MSRTVPTVSTVLPAPEVRVRVIGAQFVVGHGLASAGRSFFIRPDIQILTTALPSIPRPDFSGRTTPERPAFFS